MEGVTVEQSAKLYQILLHALGERSTQSGCVGSIFNAETRQQHVIDGICEPLWIPSIQEIQHLSRYRQE